MISDRVQLAAAEESVEGTAESLVAGDAILVMNPKFTPDVNMNQRPNKSSSLSRFASVPGARMATIEFDVELKGSGAAGTPPALGLLLQACGMSEAISAGVSVTYLPASSAIPSLTMAIYRDGLAKKIWGARGTFKITMVTAEIVLLHFVFTGADWSVSDAALLAGVTYESTVPPKFANATFTIDSYAALIGKMEIDMACRTARRVDANKDSGALSYAYTGREPVMSLDPESATVATYDWWTKLRAGSEGALTAAVGSVAGNICTVTAPKVQYVKIAESERDGLALLGIDCQLNKSAGDDELSLAFT